MFRRGLHPDKDGLPWYSVLLLPRSGENSEKFLTASAKLLDAINVGGDDDIVLHVEPACYVHVLNEDRNETRRKLPVANAEKGLTCLIFISMLLLLPCSAFMGRI